MQPDPVIIVLKHLMLLGIYGVVVGVGPAGYLQRV